MDTSNNKDYKKDQLKIMCYKLRQKQYIYEQRRNGENRMRTSSCYFDTNPMALFEMIITSQLAIYQWDSNPTLQISKRHKNVF